MDCNGILQARILKWVTVPFSQGIKPRSPALQADSLPTESQGEPKSTGVDLSDPGIELGSHSLQADSTN